MKANLCLFVALSCALFVSVRAACSDYYLADECRGADCQWKVGTDCGGISTGFCADADQGCADVMTCAYNPFIDFTTYYLFPDSCIPPTWEIAAFENCTCTSTCDPLACDVDCGTLGYKMDENGCQTCGCCDEVLCDLACENGFAIGDDGCPICQCKECPVMDCLVGCDHGYQTDENGCQTCGCCDEVLCDLACENGFAIGDDGCPICQCNQCDDFICAMYCEHGYVLDENGCPTCECVECTQVYCFAPCDYGYQLDEYGCQTCGCCEKNKCDLFCPNGYEVDETGCEICECAVCGDVLCEIFCEHGFKVDEKGCPICACKDKKDYCFLEIVIDSSTPISSEDILAIIYELVDDEYQYYITVTPSSADDDSMGFVVCISEELFEVFTDEELEELSEQLLSELDEQGIIVVDWTYNPSSSATLLVASVGVSAIAASVVLF